MNTHSNKSSHSEKAVEEVEPKKETKAQIAEHETEKVVAERDAITAERDNLTQRIAAFEAFVAEGLKTGAWNSTTATELMKK